MSVKLYKTFVLVCCFFVFSVESYAQERYLTIDSLISLANKNSKQIDISKYKISMQENATQIEKDEAYLPELNTGLSVGYLSNAHIWDNKLNYESTIKMPHTTINFSLNSGYVLYNGSANKNNILKAELEEKIAHLNYEKEQENVQFLLISKYLDLYALANQEKVYLQNIALANKRIDDIKKLIQQGMLTHNDLIRSQLQLTEFEFQLTKIRNNINITNHDMSLVLSLPESTKIVVDSTLFTNLPHPKTDSDITADLANLPELKIYGLESQVASKQADITKAVRLPRLSLYAGDNIARPFLYSIPPVDIYMHFFQVGAKVAYDVGSLYKSKNQIQQTKMNYNLSLKDDEWQHQKAEMEVHTASVKMEESWQKFDSETESYKLATNNYHVVVQKYMNKFATITDMLDASTALLSTQINVNNSQAAIVYQYFYLLKSSGHWKEVSKGN